MRANVVVVWDDGADVERTSSSKAGAHSQACCFQQTTQLQRQHLHIPPTRPRNPHTQHTTLVLNPTTPTLCADDDADAAHSLRADIVTSLQQMSITGTAICACVMGAGGSVLSSTSTVVTITLSATGSRNAPKVVAISNWRGEIVQKKSQKGGEGGCEGRHGRRRGGSAHVTHSACASTHGQVHTVVTRRHESPPPQTGNCAPVVQSSRPASL